MEEIWKDIKGYENYYQISNYGRVRSLDRYVHCEARGITRRLIKGQMIKTSVSNNGYERVQLNKEHKVIKHLVHRLVAEAFLPNTNNFLEVNHKDENTLNNSVENLEWCSIVYNRNYGTRFKRISNKLSKPINQFDLNGNFIKKWDSSVSIKKAFNNNCHVIECCQGKIKQSRGFIWKYAD